MEDILVPIFVCVVLPVSIVLIIFFAGINADNKRAKVLIKAIESNNGIDADRLAQALAKPRKTPREVLNGRLLRGCIFSFIGLVFMIIGIVGFCMNSELEDAVEGPLILGGISLSIGLSFLIVYFVTKKEVESKESK